MIVASLLLAALLVAGVALATTVGKLSFLQAKFDDQGGVQGLKNPYGVAASPDGKSVYAVSEAPDNAIATFRRNRTTGRIHFVNTLVDGVGGVDGLFSPSAVEVAPDGHNVYVTSDNDESIATFRRNRLTGKLHFLQVLKDGVGGVDGIAGTCCDMTISSDGRNVYVPGQNDDAIATFKRNQQNGKLHFVNA
jgi:6-phosphogluconolactonase (cycloisomerase 2 family)